MSMQMYFVIPRGQLDPEAMRALMVDIRRMGGFILMATTGGPIVALDDEDLSILRENPQVESANPVTLNPRGLAARQLQRIFSENLERQLSPLLSASREEPS